MRARIVKILDDVKRNRLRTASEEINELTQNEPSAELKKALNQRYDGKLLLNEVVRNHDESNLVSGLLKQGADPFLCDRRDHSAFSLAEALQKTEFLLELKKYSAEKKESEQTKKNTLVFSFKKTKQIQNHSLIFSFQNPKKRKLEQISAPNPEAEAAQGLCSLLSRSK